MIFNFFTLFQPYNDVIQFSFRPDNDEVPNELGDHNPHRIDYYIFRIWPLVCTLSSSQNIRPLCRALLRWTDRSEIDDDKIWTGEWMKPALDRIFDIRSVRHSISMSIVDRSNLLNWNYYHLDGRRTSTVCRDLNWIDLTNEQEGIK